MGEIRHSRRSQQVPKHPRAWTRSDAGSGALVPVTVVVIARDEERNIERCLASCAWADQRLVIDSGSTDSTVRLATEAGVEVVHTDWPGYGAQRERVLHSLEVHHDWILWVDADEYVSPELAVEVGQVLEDPHFSAYSIPFKLRFQGQWIDHCGWSGNRIVRLVNRTECAYPDSWVGRPQIDGPIGIIRNFLIDDDRKGLRQWLDKHNLYAELETRETGTWESSTTFRQRLTVFRVSRSTDTRPLGRAVARDLVFPSIPFRPLALFVYMYFIRLGLLDGRWGLRFCVYHAVYQMTVRAMAQQTMGTQEDATWRRGEAAP